MDEMHFLRHVNDIRDLNEIETILDRLSVQWDNWFDDYQYDTNDEMIEELKKDEDFVIFNIKDFMDDLKPLMILIDKLEEKIKIKENDTCADRRRCFLLYLLFFLFFSILNIQNETKSQGFSGCRALALPLGEPHPFRVSLNGMGCITYGKPGKMCIYIPTHMKER